MHPVPGLSPFILQKTKVTFLATYFLALGICVPTWNLTCSDIFSLQTFFPGHSAVARFLKDALSTALQEDSI